MNSVRPVLGIFYYGNCRVLQPEKMTIFPFLSLSLLHFKRQRQQREDYSGLIIFIHPEQQRDGKIDFVLTISCQRIHADGQTHGSSKVTW